MDFYYTPGSAPCRSVALLAKALDLKLNKHKINLMEGEHLKPEFLKINPQHAVPTLVDNGYTIWESRAILIYLVEKYDKSQKLYPTNPEKRGIINQRLFFDMGVLYQRFAEYYYPQWMKKEDADPEKFKRMEEGVGFLNTLLEGQTYAAGDTLTIADYPLLTTISTYDTVDFDLKKYPNVVRWYENAKKVVSGWEESWEEMLAIKQTMLDRLKK